MSRVAVIGPGALGCLFAGTLSLAGHDVGLVCRDPALAQQLERQGIVIERSGEERHARVWTVLSGQPAPSVAAVIVVVKSFDTESAARGIAPLLSADSIVVTLQNGLGNAETLAEILGPSRVLAGSTSQGATLLAPGRVRHAGAGPTYVSELEGGAGSRARAFAMLLSQAGLPTEAAAELAPVVWAKLIANVAINPLTALTGLRNGQLLDSPATATLFDDLVREAEEVARAAGVRLPFADAIAHARRTAEVTRANRSSMLQDVSRERPTEIDAITGALLALAQRHGVAVPTNAVVYRLIKGVESRYLGAEESRGA